MHRRFMDGGPATRLLAALLALTGTALAQDKIVVGNLVDFTGRTAVVGKVYGQAKIDAVDYINANGGINGKPIEFLTLDYSYEVPRAIAASTTAQVAASNRSGGTATLQLSDRNGRATNASRDPATR